MFLEMLFVYSVVQYNALLEKSSLLLVLIIRFITRGLYVESIFAKMNISACPLVKPETYT